MSIAFVFPGQGSQGVGMGRALAGSSSVARETFAEADAALPDPITTIAWDGPAEVLDLTVNAQPALLATSVAMHRALLDAWSRAGVRARPAFCAGHSMGQYSAMVAAGALSLGDGMRLVRERGRLMQASSEDGAMAAVIGLDDARLPDLEAAALAVGPFTIANRNSPGQVVVSGTRVAVEAAMIAAKTLGARRTVLLPVSVAAHSPLMERAAVGMREALAGVGFRDPQVPLLANADARPLTTAAACRNELVEHLTRGVDWVRAVRSMAAAGVTTFAEVGPGKVLVGLVKRIAPDVEAVATDDPSLPGALRLPSLTTLAPAQE